MTTATARFRESRTIADLNDLLRLDHDAVDAYSLAIGLVRDPAHKAALLAHRADHERHLETLGAHVRERGGTPTRMPHATAPLKLAVQALGAAPGDRSLLLAFKAVERQSRDKYRRFAAAADEDRHYAWVEGALASMGSGPGTISFGVVAALENLHKLIADPVEGLERELMRGVDRMADTVRGARGGSGGGTETVEQGSAGAFTKALAALEERRDVEPMVALYGEQSETSGPNDERPHRGQDGARAFWTMYRDSFESIRSTFHRIVESDEGTVMLEWTSEGTLATGGGVTYDGVSVVEMPGGRVKRFRTYFDTRDIETEVRTEARPTNRASETTPDIQATME